MLLKSVRSLKEEIMHDLVSPLRSAVGIRAAGLAPQSASSIETQESLAIGLVHRGEGDYAIGVRVQRRELIGSEILDKITRAANGEVDVRFIGRVTKRNAPWRQGRVRPLRIGASIGHSEISAGTLGAFVRDRSTGATCLLSNNHVLANENRSDLGDSIVQPGIFDGGAVPTDRVAVLHRFERLRRISGNTIDAAIALLAADMLPVESTIEGLGRVTGVRQVSVDVGTSVAKLGRTTGLRRGRVTMIEVDNLVVEFEIGSLVFDQQIEIEGATGEAFSDGGDSGALIVDDDCQAVALLFAGTHTGGAANLGVTFGNPIQPVLDTLQIDIIL